MFAFSTPLKPYLIKRLRQRSTTAQPDTRAVAEKKRETGEAEEVSEEQPSLGMPSDLGADIDEAIKEICGEIEQRKRRGSGVGMPTGQDLKGAVEEKLGRKIP